MKKAFLKLIFSMLLVGILVGCEQDVFKNKDSEINIESGYIVVQSDEHLDNLVNKSNHYTKLITKSEDFISLLDIYQHAISEDAKYFEKFEKYTADELQKMYPSGINPHSDYVIKNSHLFNFSEEGWFELKIADVRLAKLVNTDGIIKVGDTYRKYESNAVFLSKDLDLLKSLSESDYPESLSEGITSHTYEKIRIEHPQAKVISQSFQVNSCTNRSGDYRVRLYEDILVANKGNGNYEMVYGFSVHSFRHTVFGWQRRFATGYLAGRVDYQASFGFDGYTINASDPQESLGWTFVRDYNFTDSNRPEIFYSQGQGWGRDGCYCTYTGNY